MALEAIRKDIKNDLLSVSPPARAGRISVPRHIASRRSTCLRVPALLAKWAPLMGVKVARFFVQRLKTKWGSSKEYWSGARVSAAPLFAEVAS